MTEDVCFKEGPQFLVVLTKETARLSLAVPIDFASMLVDEDSPYTFSLKESPVGFLTIAAPDTPDECWVFCEREEFMNHVEILGEL